MVSKDQQFEKNLEELLQTEDEKEQQLKIIEDAEETDTTKDQKKWKIVCKGYNLKQEGSQENIFAFELYNRVKTRAET